MAVFLSSCFDDLDLNLSSDYGFGMNLNEPWLGYLILAVWFFVVAVSLLGRETCIGYVIHFDYRDLIWN